MDSIAKAFEQAKKEKRAALIPYLTAGFPSLSVSKRLLKALGKAGADIIEIGIPFSDPLADGPTIQRASSVALSQKVSTRDVFDLVKDIRNTIDTPLVIMTYYNLFYKYGLMRFADDACKAGVDGVIIPDLPLEEAGKWLKAAKGKLATIFLLAPTSTDDRIKKVASRAQGFIYCVSLTGVTGERQTLPKTLYSFIKRVRHETSLPLAVGFGISNPKQARQVAKVAEGVIIGSAFINLVQKAETNQEAVNKVVGFTKALCRALKTN